MSEPTRTDLRWPVPPDHPGDEPDTSATWTIQIGLPLDDEPAEPDDLDPGDE